MARCGTWIGLGVLVVIALPEARAELPSISWDLANTPYYSHQAPPLLREWSWSCDDLSDHWPLELRCQVFDLTAGGLGSGDEVMLVDADCGTAAAEPAVATHTYDVDAPEEGHRYGYIASCRDAEGYRYRSSRSGFYDAAAPTITIDSQPQARSSNDAPAFAFTCDDASFGFDFSYLSSPYVPDCDLRCGLKFADGRTVIATRPCDVPTVTGLAPQGTQAYADLDPGRYVFSVYGRDGAGNQGTPLEVAFTVLPPGDTAVPDTDDTDDADDTDDTDDSDEPSDSDTDTLGGGSTKDDTDPPPSTCGCVTAGPAPGGAAGVLVLLLGLSRRRRVRG